MPPDRAGLRVATWNVEWFDALFDDDGALLDDGGWSRRRDVTRAEQARGVATVLQALDADAIAIIEAPDISRRRNGADALARFAEGCGTRAREVLLGFSNDTQQEILLLYDPDVITARHAPVATQNAPRFDQVFHIDLDIDATEDAVTFSKPPLEAVLETPMGSLRLILCHVKSKAPHGARSEDEAMRIAIANRRKQLAQCIWLRRRVEGHLDADEPVIVLGDLNDGPGLDVYEKLFGRSGVEIVMGTGAGPGRTLFDPHAAQALTRRLAAQPSTARFFLHHEGRYLSALLDYILVSPDLRSRAGRWRIWHPFDDAACWRDPALRTALLHASDHFPVTLDLKPTKT